MSVSGLCEICERPDVEHTCERCGRLVCDRHFDEATGVCVECASEAGPLDRDRDPEDLPDGVGINRF